MSNFTKTYILMAQCVLVLVNNVVYVQTTTKELLKYVIKGRYVLAYRRTSVVDMTIKLCLSANSIINI